MGRVKVERRKHWFPKPYRIQPSCFSFLSDLFLFPNLLFLSYLIFYHNKGSDVAILSITLLEDRNVYITSQFVRIFKVFEDFRFISQLREEMDKVRPAVAIVTS